MGSTILKAFLSESPVIVCCNNESTIPNKSKKKKGKEVQLKETFDDKQFFSKLFLLAFNINVQLFNAAVFIKPKESKINVDKVHVSCYEIQHQL